MLKDCKAVATMEKLVVSGDGSGVALQCLNFPVEVSDGMGDDLGHPDWFLDALDEASRKRLLVEACGAVVLVRAELVEIAGPDGDEGLELRVTHVSDPVALFANVPGSSASTMHEWPYEAVWQESP